MKQTTSSDEVKPLPENYVAVLIQGSWLFAEDPDDPNRILALSPYQDDPGHECSYGLWNGGKVSPFPGSADGRIGEGELYRVEVGSSSPPAHDFATLFDGVARGYNIIYLGSKGDGITLTLGDTASKRRISFPIPDAVRPAGRLLNTPIRAGSNNPQKFDLGVNGKAVSSYVTLIFLYTRDLETSALRIGPAASFDSAVSLPTSGNPHLVFKVYGVVPGGVVIDSCSDNLHIVSTFDQMRKLIQLQDDTLAEPEYCDLGMFPTSGDQHFNSGDTGLSNKELGLPEDSVDADLNRGTGLYLASCGAGTAVVKIGNGSKDR